MHDVLVVGDGPGGLSAALFLAKNGLRVQVIGADKTAMHWAYLYNYLGIPEISGSELQRLGREQVAGFGADLIIDEVTSVARVEGGFSVTTASGLQPAGRFLVLSEGKKPVLAQQLGLVPTEDGLAVTREGRTAVEKVYAVGRMVRPGASQAIISAGDGAAAALDILAREKGTKKFADWDSPPKADEEG